MPSPGFVSITLQPGVNTEPTAAALRAGYAQSNLGRFRSGFFEKLGGWVRYFAFALPGVPRALQAWLDLNENPWLAIGTSGIAGVATLTVIDENGVNTVISPQTKTTDGIPNFATSTGTPTTVTVTDANILNPTTYDLIELRTPIAVGGIVLSGSYPIATVTSPTSFTITAASAATTTRGSLAISAISQANPGVVTYVGADNMANGDLVYIDSVAGMTQVNKRLFTVAGLNTGANTFQLGTTNTTSYTAYTSGGQADFSAVPFFTTATANGASVTVTLQDHGLSAGNSFVLPLTTTLQSSVVTITNASPAVVTWAFSTHGMTGGEPIVFTTTGTLPTGLTAGTTYYVLAASISSTTFRVAATPGGTAINTTGAGSGIHTGTVGSMTVGGTYSVLSVTDVDNFVIAATSAAICNSVVPMNSGNAEILYYIALGPPSGSGTGYSFSTYSSGPYSGTGASSTAQTGTAIAAADWTLDSWNATLMACPANGGIYAWTPLGGFPSASLIAGAPLYNSGIFVTAPRLALLAYGSTVTKDIGIAQDPLIYNISDIGDYTFWATNVVNPTTGASSQAFQSRLPTGSRIVTGAAVQNQLLLWTDLDLYAINYVNLPTIWTQTKVGSNCGTVSRHSVVQLSGVVYWRGRNNFHALAGGAPAVIPCTVWDAIFQNQDTTNLDKCFSVSVTSFNEVWFFGPSSSSPDGNCDLYAKVNVLDGAWDYGSLPRSIGIDQSVVGNPVMATPTGILYSHETGYDADGQPLIPVMRTGYFYLSEGEDFVTVDQFLPDFKFQTFDGSTTSAVVQITFYVADSFTATPRTYGPYNMTTNTEKLDVRFRGRVCAFYMTSTDTGSFWRLGSPKLRTMITGRR